MRQVVPDALLSRLRFARAVRACGVFVLLVVNAVSGCSDSLAEHEDGAVGLANDMEAGEPAGDAGSDAAIEEPCVFDVDALLERAGAPATGPRINCGSIDTMASLGSDLGGVSDCFEQQAFEKKVAVELHIRQTETTFIAGASGSLFSIRESFNQSFTRVRLTAVVASCGSLERANWSEHYCAVAVELYRCSGPEQDPPNRSMPGGQGARAGE
jgi:hypothetical protein